MKKSELLLPVGNMDMCLAAIHNGADAIYMGSPFFNARGRSKDHTFEEIAEIVDLCHLYGVQVHIAFNILLFENELDRAFETLKRLIELKVDALIIQDLGLVQMVRMISSTQVIHGSTQMSITNFEGIKLLDDLDIKRFVLGRENSLSDIKEIKENTKKEIEVFVHGALCVAYSGQCFTSESIGGRSANRGQCAQSCRFEYELLVDKKVKDLDGKKYLVSPQDLCGLDQIEELMNIGVESFKVEGRLKSKEFVATAARSYRSAIDKVRVDKNILKKNMSSTFSRGFYSGWLNGVAHQELVRGDYQDHRGFELGTVAKVDDCIYIKTAFEIKNGDGLLFIDGLSKLGSKVIYSEIAGEGIVKVKLLNKLEIKTLNTVYLNSDESLVNEVNKSIKDESLLKKIEIKISLIAKESEKLKIIFDDGINVVESLSSNLIEEAKNKATSALQIDEEVRRLGRTVYFAREVKMTVDDNIFINLKDVKKLKNECVASLNEKRISRKIDIDWDRGLNLKKISPSQKEKKLNILIRKFSQLESLISLIEENIRYLSKINYVILDYEFGADFVKSVKIAKDVGLRVFIATTRILKPSEYHNFRLIERANPHGILIRNLGALEYFKSSEYILIADFSLNVTNSLTFNYLASKGLQSICLSYDLNKDQLDELLMNVDTSLVEINIYQYMPEFHMEHCVFAAFMSKGNSFRDCGKPCEKHEVALKDMYGNLHEIKADQECRNTMYNSIAQSSLSLVESWASRGVASFRVEVLHEEGEDFLNKINVLLRYFNNEINQNDAIIYLKANEKYGLSSGKILLKDNYRDIKKYD